MNTLKAIDNPECVRGRTDTVTDSRTVAGITLQKGDCARFDTFCGLVPVKVLSIYGNSGPANSSQVVRFAVTRTKGEYKKGEVLERSALSVAPIPAIHKRRFSTTLRNYNVVANCL